MDFQAVIKNILRVELNCWVDVERMREGSATNGSICVEMNE